VPRPFYYGQIRIDPTDAQRLYVLGVQFYVSADGGKTFATSAGKQRTSIITPCGSTRRITST